MAKRTRETDQSLSRVTEEMIDVRSARTLASSVAQRKRRGHPVFPDRVSTALISSEAMYAVLKTHILALGENDVLWTKQRLWMTYEELYDSYEAMNTATPFAFETGSGNVIGGSSSIKRKMYGLMKCYLLHVHNNAPVL